MSNEKKDRDYVSIPGCKNLLRVSSPVSLLALYRKLKRNYVEIIGLADYPLQVSSLSLDLLNAKVLAYRIDSYMRFTVVLDGLGGFTRWLG